MKIFVDVSSNKSHGADDSSKRLTELTKLLNEQSVKISDFENERNTLVQNHYKENVKNASLKQQLAEKDSTID